MNIEAALPGFIAEATDLLREMEGALLECGGGAVSAETINLIFRSAHTIKGSAGLVGLETLVGFVHVVETVLDDVRLNRTPLGEELISLLLSCKDHIQSLLGYVGTAAEVSADLTGRGEQLLTALRRVSGVATVASSAPEADRAAGPVESAAATSSDWHLSLRFGPGIFAAGMDPLGLIRYLRTFCEFRTVRVIEEALPPDEAFQPESCYLGFEIDLCTSAARSRIEAAFEFVREDCAVVLTAPQSVQPVAAGPGIQPASTAPAGRRIPASELAASATVRVDAAKLDSLIGRIGELIIAAAGVSMSARSGSAGEIQERASTLAALDDGGGLKRDKIIAKAREKGLIQEDRTLTDAETFNLIFEPGFSTADSVTNLSGRGVGMDVVKRNITALRGNVAINFIRLRELLGSSEPPSRRPSIVVVKHAGERAGIVVDALLGEFQTVIKPLGKMFRKVDFLSGSSILGTGEVALILDVPALVQHAIARTRGRVAA